MCNIEIFHQLFAILSIPTEKNYLESDEEDDEDEEENEDCSAGPSMSNDPDFDQESFSEPHLITQGELDDFVRDLELPNNKAELLGSQLQQ